MKQSDFNIYVENTNGFELYTMEEYGEQFLKVYSQSRKRNAGGISMHDMQLIPKDACCAADLYGCLIILPECQKCIYLPICLGGCAKSRAALIKECCFAEHWLKEYIDNVTRDIESRTN